MFENPMNPFANGSITDDHREKNVNAHRYNSALSKFTSALLKGKAFRMGARVLCRKPFLFDLNAIKSDLNLQGCFYAGIRVVRIDSIIGSEGKVSDFDRVFHPLNEASRQRWVGMAIAYLSRLPLPPVQLIQVGDAYFVRDGHHRISVARAFEQVAVDAEVITWNALPPFPWQPDAGKGSMIVLKRAVD